MATIQFGGLMTGIDTNALIDGLIQVERRSIDILESQKVSFQAQQGVLTILGGNLASLKSSTQALSLSIDFNRRAAASSDTTVLTATADSTAQVGSYNIIVDTLAKARSVKSTTSYTSTTNTVDTGTLTITVGSTSTNITVDATNNTLTGLRDAINNSGAAATASIINVSASSTPDYRLVVQSKNTGTANAVTLSATGSLIFADGGTQVQAAADAKFSVNSLEITRSSNTVSDVITGVTLTLLKEGDRDGVLETTDPSSKVTVSSDTAGLKSSIQTIVDDYNAVAELINEQLELDPETNKQGVLAGDPVLRGVLSRLRKELSTPGGNETSFIYLSDIGISFQEDGTLELDDAKLTSALDSDPTAVSKLFLSSQNGIGKRIPDVLDGFISSVDGALTFRQNGITASISNIDKKITREEERIAALEKRLIDQFTALEKLVSELNAQSQFLSRQFNSLSS